MSQLHDPLAVARATRCQVAGVTANLEIILWALDRAGILTARVAIGAIATTAVETASTFMPIHEYGNRAYFEKYDGRVDLGNTEPGDGFLYRGAGFGQLTGRANFRRYGQLIGVELEQHPELACDPQIAAKVLAAFFLHEIRDGKRTYEYCNDANWPMVRETVDGGDNGMGVFLTAVHALLPLAAA